MELKRFCQVFLLCVAAILVIVDIAFDYALASEYLCLDLDPNQNLVIHSYLEKLDMDRFFILTTSWIILGGLAQFCIMLRYIFGQSRSIQFLGSSQEGVDDLYAFTHLGIFSISFCSSSFSIRPPHSNSSLKA